MENHRSEREPTGSTNLTSGAVNFWKMEGANTLSEPTVTRGSFGGILSFPEMQI